MTIDWTHEDEEGYEVTDKLPAVWEICDHCGGDGKHSHAIGAITSDEWANDWAPEEQESYLRGDYDRECEVCNGSGKVKVLDEARVEPSVLLAYHAYQDERAEWRRQEAYERRMGY